MKEKIQNNYNAVMLFACIIISLIPTVLYKNIIEANIYTVVNAISFIIQIIIGIHLIIKNKVEVKEIFKKYTKYIVLIIGILFISQLINLLKGMEIKFNDIVNIGAITVNVTLFILLIGSIKLKEKDFITFMKMMLILAMVACAYNLFIIAESIPKLLDYKNGYNIILSSFFPNRNQFGLFLVVAILSNLFIICKDKSKKYKWSLAILFFNLILTMSRTAILAGTIAFLTVVLLDEKVKTYIKTNIKKCIIIVGVFVILVTLLVTINKDLTNVIDDLFIRSETIASGSGRTNIWNTAIKIITENNIVSGTGRFQTLELLKIEISRAFAQFHNVAIEMYAIGGIIGVALYIFLLYKVYSNVKNSQLENKYKQCYLATLIAFIIASTFESILRFSIGYVDTIAMIYYIVIPLMFSRNIENKENKKEENTTIVEQI